MTVHIPDRFSDEAVVGWRVWRIALYDGEPLRLLSPVYPLAWEARHPTEANCIRHLASCELPHAAPDPACTCGLWACKFVRVLATHSGSSPTMLSVVGKVSLWGRVVEYSGGWRGQFGYPYELVVIPPKYVANDRDALRDIRDELAEAYGVDVAVLGDPGAGTIPTWTSEIPQSIL